MNDKIEQDLKINLSKISFGTPEEFNVIVEIPRGSNLKYEYDEASDSLKLDFVFKDLVFPFNYGFIPHTLGGDGDVTVRFLVLFNRFFRKNKFCEFLKFLRYQANGPVF